MNTVSDAYAEIAKPAASESTKDVTARLNYVSDYEGSRAFYDVRDHAGSNIVWDARELTIHDVRPHVGSMTLDDAGFAFVKHRSAVAEDPALFEGNLKERNVNVAGLSAKYETELCELIKRVTGAREVFPRAGALVFRTSMRAGTRGWAPPAEFVHMDFAASAMPNWLDLTLKANGLKLAPYRRMALFQAWRAVSPGPQDSTLAVCDGTTVPQSDCVFIDSRIGPPEIPGNSWESRMSRYSDSHRWYYMPDMEADDVVLFKGFDSDTPMAMNAMHSAFRNPLGQDGPPRRSIEARIIAIFD